MSNTKFIHSLVLGGILAVVCMTTPAFAVPDMGSVVGSVYDSNAVKTEKKNKVAAIKRKNTNNSMASFKKVSVSGNKFNPGPKPGRWCGWWMRTQLGGGPEYNLARNWAKRGRPASGPQVGVVVVWRGHVGVITGRSSDGRWIVKSGNDGNAVRERPRSLKHRTGMPIAYRYV